MLDIITTWINSLWGSMEQDITFAVIGGVIILFVQLLNAGFGLWKNIGLEKDEFDWKYLVYTLLREVGLMLLLVGAVALAHMLANFAEISILPGFEIGDVPTAALLTAYGADVLVKAKSIWDNLLFIFTGDNNEDEEV